MRKEGEFKFNFKLLCQTHFLTRDSCKWTSKKNRKTNRTNRLHKAMQLRCSVWEKEKWVVSLSMQEVKQTLFKQDQIPSTSLHSKMYYLLRLQLIQESFLSSLHRRCSLYHLHKIASHWVDMGFLPLQLVQTTKLNKGQSFSTQIRAPHL